MRQVVPSSACEKPTHGLKGWSGIWIPHQGEDSICQLLWPGERQRATLLRVVLTWTMLLPRSFPNCRGPCEAGAPALPSRAYHVNAAIKFCLFQSQHLETEIKHQFVLFPEFIIHGGCGSNLERRFGKLSGSLGKHLFNNLPTIRQRYLWCPVQLGICFTCLKPRHISK